MKNPFKQKKVRPPSLLFRMVETILGIVTDIQQQMSSIIDAATAAGAEAGAQAGAAAAAGAGAAGAAAGKVAGAEAAQSAIAAAQATQPQPRTEGENGETTGYEPYTPYDGQEGASDGQEAAVE